MVETMFQGLIFANIHCCPTVQLCSLFWEVLVVTPGIQNEF
jgi:hypothetical protein